MRVCALLIVGLLMRTVLRLPLPITMALLVRAQVCLPSADVSLPQPAASVGAASSRHSAATATLRAILMTVLRCPRRRRRAATIALRCAYGQVFPRCEGGGRGARFRADLRELGSGL